MRWVWVDVAVAGVTLGVYSHFPAVTGTAKLITPVSVPGLPAPRRAYHSSYSSQSMSTITHSCSYSYSWSKVRVGTLIGTPARGTRPP